MCDMKEDELSLIGFVEGKQDHVASLYGLFYMRKELLSSRRTWRKRTEEVGSTFSRGSMTISF